MSDVTRILEEIERGDPTAAEKLLPLVYEELRKLAAARMADEALEHTLQPTALVHEAYLRLTGPTDDARWDSRGHFFAAAAEAMRRILVESARRRGAEKRGSGRKRTEVDFANFAARERPDEVLAVHEALDALAVADPQAAELVKLRYFVGMSVPDAAKALHVSARTAERLWTFGRAWLRRAIEET